MFITAFEINTSPKVKSIKKKIVIIIIIIAIIIITIMTSLVFNLCGLRLLFFFDPFVFYKKFYC